MLPSRQARIISDKAFTRASFSKNTSRKLKPLHSVVENEKYIVLPSLHDVSDAETLEKSNEWVAPAMDEIVDKNEGMIPIHSSSSQYINEEDEFFGIQPERLTRLHEFFQSSLLVDDMESFVPNRPEILQFFSN
ncbi:hypothetical protein PCE1_000756 [Barthelona sp. PCE]